MKPIAGLYNIPTYKLASAKYVLAQYIFFHREQVLLCGVISYNYKDCNVDIALGAPFKKS